MGSGGGGGSIFKQATNTVENAAVGATRAAGDIVASTSDDLANHPLQAVGDVALAPLTTLPTLAMGAAKGAMPSKPPVSAGIPTAPASDITPLTNSTTAGVQQGTTPAPAAGMDIAANAPSFTQADTQAQGRASTILTGPNGLDDDPTTARRKLTAA